jgi:serine/threonine protein kinase
MLANEPEPDVESVLLVRALEEYLAALEAGDRPKREDFLARYPDIADVLAEPLANLEVLQAVAPAGRQRAALETSPSEADLLTQPALGDYRILREVGRGGMGIVYEAEQISLGRRVALKVLPWAIALDAKHLQRFKNEAHAAAQLHHTNIVPVFGIGCERGVHYYAMQFIDGRSLSTLIEERRSLCGWRSASRGPTSELSANAATHQSSPGQVLPQPSSELPPDSGSAIGTAEVLLTERSANGPAFFRLAARLGLQAAEALEHAHQLGIVHRDIKPSNLLVDVRGNLWVTDFGVAHVQGGAQLTTTGDIVGTLRYMSPEQALAQRGLLDQRTDIYSLGVTLYELLTLEPAFDGHDRQELLHQIASQEPRPPRRLNAALPADLETILLKAIAKDPAGRYQTAQEMADDLRRFLADEPIRARRPTLLQKTAKWCRRHRAIVTASAAVGVVGLMLSTIIFWYGKVQTDAQRQRAEDKLELARTVVDDMYIRAEKLLEYEPQMESVQKEFLEKALHFYEDFARELGGAPTARFKRAQALHRIAAIELLRSFNFAAAEPANRHAMAAAKEAVALLEQLKQEEPDAAEYQNELATCHSTLAEAAMYHHLDEAEQEHRASAACYGALAERYPEQASYVFKLACCYYKIGELLRLNSPRTNGERAPAAYTRARDLLQGLLGRDPKNVEYRNYLAGVYSDWGELQISKGQGKEGEESLQKAVQILEPLSADFELLPDFRHQLGKTYTTLAVRFWQTKRPAEAEKTFRKAVDVLEKLVVSHPRVPRFHSWLAIAQDGLAVQLHARHELTSAVELEEKAISHEHAARQTNPQNFGYRSQLQQQYNNLGGMLLELGQYKRAADAAVGAADIIPGCPLGASYAAAIYTRCFDQSSADERLAPSELTALQNEYTERARQLVERIVTNGQGNSQLQNEAAWLLATFPDERARDPQRAALLAERVVKQEPKFAACWNTLGVARYRLGDWKGAITALEKANHLNAGKDPSDALFLAMAHWRQGDKGKAKTWFDKAVAIKKPSQMNEELRRFHAEAAALLGANESSGSASQRG